MKVGFFAGVSRYFTLLLALWLVAMPAGAAEDDESINDFDSYYTKYYYADPGVDDPLEGLNRAIFSFNQTLDNYLLRPVAVGYRWIIPVWGRDRVTSFFNNLEEPVTFVNAVLQADVDHAFVTFWRFFINSTIGIAGLFDYGPIIGLEHRPEDFGQTLAVWGVPSGAYLVLPLLGSSNIRDGLGMVVDRASDPNTYIDREWAFDVDEDWVMPALIGTNVVNTRANVLPITDDLEKSSIDLYATYRTLYGQRRGAQIRNSATTTTNAATSGLGN